MEADDYFLCCWVVSCEAKLHASGYVNTHNALIWGSVNPHAMRELEWALSQVNVWCSYFARQGIDNFIFQQGGVPPHQTVALQNHQAAILNDSWCNTDGTIP